MKHLKKVRKLILILVGVTTLLMTGCFTLSMITTPEIPSWSYYLRPDTTQNDNVEVVYLQGKTIAVSRGEKTTVALDGFKTTGDELVLYVGYGNSLYGERVDVIPENIVVYSVNGQGQETQLWIYPAETYLERVQKQQERQQYWGTLAQSFVGALAAEAAARSTSSTSGYVYDPKTGEYIYGHATTETYDASKKAEAEARNRAALEQTQQQTQQQNAQINATLSQKLLRRTTLFPGQSVEGSVIVECNLEECPEKFIIEIPIGKEVHTFTFLPGY